MKELNQNQIDALCELVNMGVGRAANALNDLTDSHIILKVPSIKIYRFDELHNVQHEFGDEPVAAVLQNFKGNYHGKAALIFPTESALSLVKGVTGEDPDDDDLDAIQSATLTEIGNIVINSLIGTISNILGNSLDFELSEYHKNKVSELFKGSNISQDNSYFLLSEVHFNIEKLDINGHILLTFDIDSLEALFELIGDVFGD